LKNILPFIFIVITSLLSPISLSMMDNLKPKIQLATTYFSPEKINDYWVSEKLDGMRGYWTGTTLLSRQGNKINVPSWFIMNWPNIAMDGELWIGRGKFQATISCIKRLAINNSCWRNIRFMLFDLPKNTSPFTQRITAMEALVKHHHSPYLNVITQFKVTTIKILDEKLIDIVNNGGEGLMLHHQNAYYTQGRSRHLMKLKHYQDAEAVVIEHIKGRGKYQGMLGALVVKTPENISFKIGSGFTDKQRSNPPPIGSIITYKYTGKTLRGVPRFASFLHIRK
jgi:DNA ligase-1